MVITGRPDEPHPSHFRSLPLHQYSNIHHASLRPIAYRRVHAASWATSPPWRGRESSHSTLIADQSSTALDSYVSELGSDISYEKRCVPQTSLTRPGDS